MRATSPSRTSGHTVGDPDNYISLWPNMVPYRWSPRFRFFGEYDHYAHRTGTGVGVKQSPTNPDADTNV